MTMRDVDIVIMFVRMMMIRLMRMMMFMFMMGCKDVFGPVLFHAEQCRG